MKKQNFFCFIFCDHVLLPINWSENEKFVDKAQQCFAFTPQANFYAHIWIFTEVEGDGIESRLSS